MVDNGGTATGVSVAIRIRPLLTDNTKPIWRSREDRVICSTTDPSCSFGYDHVFGEDWTTQDIYGKIGSPVVKSFVEGFNATIFAYGQTASGKSYTIMGDPEKECLGIIPYSLIETFSLFEQNPQREFLLNVSFMEIYNEKITDLLNVDNNTMRIRETRNGTVTVANLTEVTCICVEDVVNVLSVGNENRTVGETNFNLRSSRAHTIFTIMLESRDTTTDNAPARISSMNLVDLAGSEKPSLASNESHRFKEGAFINSSLLALGRVISGLAEGRSHVPYRESKLTRILQPSLGGNSKTLIICTVSPTSQEETVSTLRFASCATKVKNKPIINEVMTVEQKLREKVQSLIEQNQFLTGQLKGNLDTEERKELMSKIELLVTAKSDAEKKAEKLENELKKHVVGRPQVTMDNRRLTYLIPPVSTPTGNKMAIAEEVFHMSPMFKRSDTVIKAKRRQTMFACRSKNVTFVAKTLEDDEMSDYDTTPIKALNFDLMPTMSDDQPSHTNVSTQTDPHSCTTETQTEPLSYTTETQTEPHSYTTETQTELCSHTIETQTEPRYYTTETQTQTEAHSQTTTCIQTDTDSHSKIEPHSDAQTQTSRPIIVHKPDSCIYTDLDQSYLCKHRTEATVAHSELDTALYVNDEHLIEIEELREVTKGMEEEILKLANQLKDREEANQAQEEILCSLQSKLSQSTRKCQSLQEEVASLSNPTTSLSQELEMESLKSKNVELTQALKSSEIERVAVKDQLGTVKEQLSKLESVLTKQIPDSVTISKMKEEITKLKSELKDCQVNEDLMKTREEELNSEITQLKTVLQDCQVKEDNMKTREEELKSEIIELKSVLQDCQVKEDQMKTREEEWKSEITELKSVLQECQVKEDNMKTRQEQLGTEITELKSELQQFQANKELIKGREEQLESEATKVAPLQSKVEELEKVIIELQDDCKDYQRVIEQCNRNGDIDAMKIEELEEENYSLKSDAEKLKEDLKNSEIMVKEYQLIVETCDKNGELDAGKIDKLEDENWSLENNLKKLQEEYKKSEILIKEIEQKCNYYVQMNEEMSQSNTVYVERIKKLEEENHSLGRHLKNLESNQEQVMVTGTTHKDLERKNKELQVIIDELKRDEQHYIALVERCEKAADEETNRAQELDNLNYDLEIKIKALEDERETADGKITELQAQITSLRVQHDQQMKAIQHCSKTRDEHLARIQGLQHENEELKDRMEEIMKSQTTKETVSSGVETPQLSVSKDDENSLQKQIRMLNLKLQEVYRISGRGDLLEENIQLKTQVGELRGSLKHTQKEEAYYKDIVEKNKTLIHDIKVLKAEKESLTKEIQQLSIELEQMKKEKRTSKQLEVKCDKYKTELLRYRAQRNELRMKYENNQSLPVTDEEPHPVQEPHPPKHEPNPSNPALVENKDSTNNQSKVDDYSKPSKDSKPSVDTPTDPKTTPTSSEDPPVVDNRHLTSHLPFDMPPNVSEDHLFVWGLHPSQKDQFPNPMKPQMSKDQPHLLGFDWEQSILTDPDNIGKLPFTVTPEKPKSHPRECQQQ